MPANKRWNMAWREVQKPKVDALQRAAKAKHIKSKSTRLEEEYLNVILM